MFCWAGAIEKWRERDCLCSLACVGRIPRNDAIGENSEDYVFEPQIKDDITPPTKKAIRVTMKMI